MHKQLAQIPFSDKSAAESSLKMLIEDGRPGLLENLGEALAETPDPLRVALALNRYLDAAISTKVEMDLMAQSPPYLHMLTAIFAQSRFLSDMVCRHPGYVSWLWEQADFKEPRPRGEMLAELTGNDAHFDSFDRCCQAMRRFRQREILRIAVRDIVHRASVASVTQDLSNLADVMLDTAIIGAQKDLETRFGTPQRGGDSAEPADSTFAILAMGKLGGRELNFSSDIDLLFIYSREGKTSGGSSKAIDNSDYFRRLGEMVIKALSERTDDGIIFRVDMRLRPFGSSGPLAVGFDSAVDYYANYGRAWERQALIKARPCAGDRTLGEAFLERLRPFVYPKYFDDTTLEDIRGTKEQTEAMIARGGQAENEVKLGPGGIRDIEFTVQMLQMLNGGRRPELRTTNTLQAIQALESIDSLTSFEATALTGNYILLRHIEHRLQIEDGRQCHTLPADPEALDAFAKRMGFDDAHAFLGVYQARTTETRGILERFLAAKGDGQLWVADLLNPFSDGLAGIAKLEDLGFANPQKAREELMQLAAGTESKRFTRLVHQHFAAIAPFLLNALSFTASPDAILMRLSQILSGMSAPSSLYGLLQDTPALCHFIVTLVANSEYLCNILIRDPGLLDTLSSVDALDIPSTRAALEEELAGLQAAHDADAAPYRLRDGEMLRVAMRELGRNITVAEVGDELTQLAEVILGDALEKALAKTERRFGPTEIPFTILGLGKFGGWEMGYGSDLDLVFVYEADKEIPSGMSPAEYFADTAARTLKSLKEGTRYGILYDIDARLRPDGSKGMLAIDHHHLADYYRQYAQPWERHALMKVRAVAGDSKFSAQVEKMAKDIAFSLPLDADTLEHIETMRQKIVENASPFDLKKYSGGIAEIEFTTRFWQLRHVPEYPELKRGDVFGALDILLENDLVDEDDALTLRRAYGQLRRILNRIRMMDGGQSSRLPESPRAQQDLAARLNIGEDLLDYVKKRREQVHHVYQKTYQESRALVEN